jgi:hypothetical protein
MGILRGGEFEEVDLAVVVGVEGVGGGAAVEAEDFRIAPGAPWSLTVCW